jgi:oligopeptide transport system substrate-binding protein
MQKRLLGILASVAVIAAACGGATTSSAPPAASGEPPASADASAPPDTGLAAEQVLRIDLGTEPPALDPNLAQDSTSIAVLNALHRGLTYLNEDLVASPALAESWDFSDGGATITFHLRDAVYSNGDPIVAGDFVYSWKRLVDPRTAAPYAYNMADVVGGADLVALAGADPAPTDAEIDALLEEFGVSAPDDKTFVVNLVKPASYFVSIAGLWHSAPIQASWIESPNATEAENYVSSGPFLMTTWDHNSQIILEPNPTYWGQAPTLTRIEMSMIVEPAAGQAAYEAGELDMFLTPAADIRRVQDDPVMGPEVVNSPQFAIGYYNYNTAEGPTANLNFRKALTQSIDKEALIELAWGGTGVVANTIVPPGMLAYNENLNPYPYDPAAAQASFATALTELGFASAADVPVLRFTYNTGSDHENRVAFMAQAWTDTLGLQFDQQGSEFGVFLTARHDLEYDIARNAWGQDYPHPNNFLNDLFRCGGGNNDTGWCNEEYDALIDQAAAEPDAAAQEALYQQAEEIMINDAVVIPLRFPISQYTVKPYVIDYIVTPGDAQLPGDLFYETIKILEH